MLQRKKTLFSLSCANGMNHTGKRVTGMLQIAVFTYGLLASFIWASAERNSRAAVPHPPVLRHMGYLVVGLSAGVAIALTGAAIASLYLGKLLI